MWRYNYTVTPESELYHYGVKGMKWRKGRKTPLKGNVLKRTSSITLSPKSVKSDKQEIVRLKQRVRSAKSSAATAVNKFKKQNLTKGAAARRVNKALDSAKSAKKTVRNTTKSAVATLKNKVATKKKVSAAKKRAKARKKKYKGTTQARRIRG